MWLNAAALLAVAGGYDELLKRPGWRLMLVVQLWMGRVLTSVHSGERQDEECCGTAPTKVYSVTELTTEQSRHTRFLHIGLRFPCVLHQVQRLEEEA